ncbi:MAG: 6-phosphogluconolactonase [Planctomycetota bacterium]|jgi:6-phosphogluconolactonase
MRTTNKKLKVVVAADSGRLARKATELFVADARKAIEARDQFCAAISRRTPRRFFDLLGRQPDMLDWEKVHLFWVDECCGPANVPKLTCKLAARRLLSNAPIPPRNVHTIPSDDRNCGSAASIYEQTIYTMVDARKNGMPRFDLVILNMGADGHIASLFPDTPAFFDTNRCVRTIYFMDSRYTRITLTNPVLCAAAHLVVLVCGTDKAAILRDMLTTEPDQVRYPLHAVWPILDKVTWLLDRDAAGFLLTSSRPTHLHAKGWWDSRTYGRL